MRKPPVRQATGTVLHFRRDRVVERFSQSDLLGLLGLLVQMGAVPAPAWRLSGRGRR